MVRHRKGLTRRSDLEDRDVGYNVRDRSYYPYHDDPECRNNPHILEWWSSRHDQIIVDLIAEHQWTWDRVALDLLVGITSPEKLHKWRERDPLCSQWAWRSILLNFARSRAVARGFTKRMRKAEWKVCPLCGKLFVEDSLPYPLVERLGVDHIDFCAPCMSNIVLHNPGNDDASAEEVLAYLSGVAEVLQQVPSARLFDGKDFLLGLEYERRVSLLKLLRRKPSLARVKALFGSWLGALVEAGVLADGVRPTGRGTQCLAKDGHVCLSLAEKTIDDFLYARGIEHEKEPAYPEGNYRADFAVSGVFIEYFGLAGDPEYDEKTSQKKALCREHGVGLIAIYPRDLPNLRDLERKLGPVLGKRG